MEKVKLVPPDGGWGWLVLFGATLVNILVPGTVKSFGVLFVEFLEAFEATPSQGMWIPALCYFLYSSLGPVSSILSVAWSYRIVTFIGGACAAGGMILSFWATSLPILYFTYGVLVGCGAGLSFPPTVYIVTSYFVKLRGVANGICISGSAFGSILLPPLLRIILETYGYRGAVLLMGGITLNVFVAALFYDPVENHYKKIKEEDKPSELLDPAKFMISEDSMASLPQLPHTDSFLEHSDLSDAGFNRSASSAAVQHMKSPHRERKISMPTGRHEVMRAKGYSNSRTNMNSSTALHSVPEKQNANGTMDMFVQGKLPSSRKLRTGPPRRSTSTSSFQYVSTAYHGSTLTLQPEIFASSFSLKSNSNKMIGASPKIDRDAPKKIKLFDVTLLKDPLYLIILISNATNAISYTNFIILLPAYAQNLGFDKNSGALLLSIVSALDLVGRIGGSALSDLTKFPKSYYFVGGLFMSGVSLAMLPFFLNYWVIALFCSVFGLASGTYVGITAIVMADMLGEERLQSTYGISLFVNGILQLIGPPICGVWFEATQSFVSLFCSLGVILAAGSLLWSFVPFIKKKGEDDDDEDEA
ncbi:monocarboxylate transporter 13 isoform X2 [Cylas formicarius]|nr:monocarboxylate transporter 13 isoform X2 [Cylas formicarius]